MQKVLTAALIILGATQVWAYDFDKNVPGAVKNQMIQDLDFVTTLSGENQSKLHSEIYGSINGAGYKKFFDTRIYSIGKDSCGGGNAVACVYPAISNKMFITDNYIKFNHPAIARLMVVFHEARHTEDENDNWGHADCPVPFLDENGKDMKSIWTGAMLEGQPACDETPYGSYGSSTIMLKNISKNCTSCNEKVKMDAGIYADDQLKRIVNANAKKQMMDDIFKN